MPELEGELVVVEGEGGEGVEGDGSADVADGVAANAVWRS